jgi:hypothetical protein
MAIFFDTAVAFVIAFLILRNKLQTPKRHVLGFLLTGLLSGIIAFVSFEIFNSCVGANCAGARFNAIVDSQIAWVLGLMIGFVLGAVVAKLVRPKAPPASA